VNSTPDNARGEQSTNIYAAQLSFGRLSVLRSADAATLSHRKLPEKAMWRPVPIAPRRQPSMLLLTLSMVPACVLRSVKRHCCALLRQGQSAHCAM